MIWDGDRQQPGVGTGLEPVRPRSRRRLRSLLSTGVAIAFLVGLLVPSMPVLAATGSAKQLLSAWSSVSHVDVVQESSSRISYRGTWKRVPYSGYLGGKAMSTNANGAKAAMTFAGAAIAWVGPVGPTRGKARVYIDGALAATVNTRADSFRPARVLFQKSWATAGTHRIQIVTLGTSGHPTVALDALLVRVEVPTQDATSVTTPPTATPAPTPTPTPARVTTSSVRVTSIPALLTALADNNVTDIVVANGTYRVSPAGLGRSDSLWIGSRFAGRTRAVTVRAETRGGVTLDGGGSTAFGGLTFTEGAHDQTWDGFRFANGQATDTGVIVFGGYAGRAAPHHITLRAITILRSVTGHNDLNDHGIYFSQAVGGPHDLLLEDIRIDGTGSTPLSTALHFYHSEGTDTNVWNVTIRRLTIAGTYTAISMWDSTLHDVTIDEATITNAIYGAMQYEQPGTRITLANMTSTGSGKFGFYSSLGSNPPGVTFINDSFR